MAWDEANFQCSYPLADKASAKYIYFFHLICFYQCILHISMKLTFLWDIYMSCFQRANTKTSATLLLALDSLTTFSMITNENHELTL